MAGDDPIMAVSKVFASLADEGGAAADSLDTLNTILKNSLNRTLIRFNRTMADTVKSVAAFNLGLKSASKRMSANVTQKQAARMGAASQASEAIHRTQAYYNQQQANKATKQPQFDQILSELADVLNNRVLYSLQNFSDKMNAIVDLLTKAAIAFGALKAGGAAVEQFSATTKEAQAIIAKTYHGTMLMPTGGKYANMTDRELRGEAAFNESVFKSDVKLEQMQNVAAGIKQEADAMKARYEEAADMMTLFNGALGDSTKEFGRMRASWALFTDLMGEFDAMQSKIKSFQESIRPTAEAAKKSAMTMHVADLGDVFSKLRDSISGKMSSASTAVFKFIGSLKLTTALLGGAFITAIAYASYAMLDFGKNAIPRLYNYLLKPLQTVYEFVNGPLNQAFSKVTSFVSVLNPAYGEQASRALDDLSAIIGRVLLPVFNAMLGSLKVFTSFLSINTDRLKGTMQALGNVISNIGAVVISNFFQLLGQAQPIFEQLTAAFQRAIPIINNSLVKLFREIQKHIPTFIKAIDALGMMLEMYLKQKLQEFANEAKLASKAAANQARAMELFGEDAMTLSMAFNNLGYALKDLVLQIEAVIIELMRFLPKSVFIGEPDKPFEELGPIDQAAQNLFNPKEENLPWNVRERQKKGLPPPEAGAGQFDIFRMEGADFGVAAGEGLQEGFAAKGAAFQEIGQLGKNLAAASFGMGAGTVEDQQLNVQQQILGAVNGMLQNQNQFNGAAPVQGVR